MYWTSVCTCVRVCCSAGKVRMKGAQQSSILLFIEKHCHYKVKQVWPLTRPSDIFNSPSSPSSPKLYKLSLERISASLNKRNFKFRLNRFFCIDLNTHWFLFLRACEQRMNGWLMAVVYSKELITWIFIGRIQNTGGTLIRWQKGHLF